jgi:hypothetical protein
MHSEGSGSPRPRLPAGETRAELELLLRCAHARPGPTEAAEIAALCDPALDWRFLCRTAQEHALVPLLFTALESACPERVPPRVFQHLRDVFHTSVARSLLLTGELLRIVDLLAACGIMAVPFKGPSLAQSAYGRVELRPCGDLDLLLRPGEVLAARELLGKHGFEAFPRLSPARERAFLRTECEFWFGEARELVSLETHWAIREPAYAFPFDLERLWKRLDCVTLGGRPVPSLRAEDLLLVLAAHGAKHRWVNLRLGCDLAELLRSQPGLDWDDVLHHARALHAERVLRLGLSLAQELLAAPVPPEIQPWLAGDPTVPALVREVRKRLFAPMEIRARTERDLRLYLRMRERFRDRARYFWSTLLTPTLEDWSCVSLPDALYGLYYLVRPIRLLGKYGRAFRGRGGRG